jgi:hypothetical protein
MREVDGSDGRFVGFEPGPSRGRVVVTYRPAAGRLHVDVAARDLAPSVRQVVVLNEESAAFGRYSDAAGTLAGGRIGSWTAVRGRSARLRDGGVEWGIDRPAPATGFFVARELRPERGIDFSGLEMVFGPSFTGVAYDVRVGETP